MAITGASGLIGGAVARHLRARGDAVLCIGRAANADVRWNIDRRELDPAALEGCAAVVHFAGAPIAHRWTSDRKREIRESRVRGTALLAQTIARLSPPPRVFLSGSAIGVYGDCGDDVLTEASAPGVGFLAGVTREWEASTRAAEDAGIPVAHLRTGLVLSSAGGVLAKLITPYRLGLGGRIGNGTQWMSWIGLHDYVRAVEFLMERATSGPVNMAAPAPVTASEFARTLGAVISRPAIFPAPAFALRLVFGKMAEETMLASQRVEPVRLLRDGFAFDEPSLAGALRRELV